MVILLQCVFYYVLAQDVAPLHELKEFKIKSMNQQVSIDRYMACPVFSASIHGGG